MPWIKGRTPLEEKEDFISFPFQIYVVNLQQYTQRWYTTKEKLNNIPSLQNAPIHRQIATYGQNLHLWDLYYKNELSKRAYKSILGARNITGFSMTIGALGCAYSYVSLPQKPFFYKFNIYNFL